MHEYVNTPWGAFMSEGYYAQQQHQQAIAQQVAQEPITSLGGESTLRDKQARFVVMVGQLIQQATTLGYELTLGDAYRDPRVPYGHPRSLHKLRLAIDLNLFKDGRFLAATADHRPLGEWWESIGGTWGGRFRDGNHYSLAHGGMQ